MTYAKLGCGKSPILLKSKEKDDAPSGKIVIGSGSSSRNILRKQGSARRAALLARYNDQMVTSPSAKRKYSTSIRLSVPSALVIVTVLLPVFVIV